MRPIIVEDKPVRVHIGITLEEDGDMGFEVYSQAGRIAVNAWCTARAALF
jgi:hypothetical protein